MNNYPFVTDNGDVRYTRLGITHRDVGPAYIHSNGFIMYYRNGTMHRIGGPAVIDSRGIKTYWVRGDYMPEFEYFITYGGVL